MLRKFIFRLLTVALVSATGVSAQEIVLRHDLKGEALDAFATLTLRFNDGLKGRGRILLQDVHGVGIDERRVLPHLALLDPDDSMEFFGTRPRFQPLHELLRNAKSPLNVAAFYPPVKEAVGDGSGRLLALPLGLNWPVLLVNRAALKKAGVAEQKLPSTWWEVQKLAGQLYDSGHTCPLTSSRFSWLHLENIASQHGESAVKRSGKTEHVAINSLVNVKHLALLASWQKSRYFHYAGAAREGDARFLSGECAMLTGESSIYLAARRTHIDADMTDLPYYDDVYGVRPDDIVPDGAGLWALAGHKKEDYALIARFMAFMMQAEVQKSWVKATGFLPMTPAGLSALQEAQLPTRLLDGAQKRLTAQRKDNSRLRHGPLRDRLHAILGEEIAFVWNADRAAKDALDSTVRRVNGASLPAATVALRQKK